MNICIHASFLCLFLPKNLCASKSYYYFVNDDNTTNIYFKKGTWDGCPPDAHRCDDNCIFEDDDWNTPCTQISPNGHSRAACVDWDYPYYCHKTNSCLPVDRLCGEECFTHSLDNKYTHLWRRYNCGGECLTEEMSCDGSCDQARAIDVDEDEDAKNIHICGDQCLTRWNVERMYVCQGKCLKLTEPCDGGCTEGHLVGNSSEISTGGGVLPYRVLCDGHCTAWQWLCDGHCQGLRESCGGKCFNERVLGYDLKCHDNKDRYVDYDDYVEPVDNTKWQCEGVKIPKTQACNGKCQTFMCKTTNMCLVDDQKPCNGVSDCEDGSDESLETCIGPSATCPGVYYCDKEHRLKCKNEVCGSCQEENRNCFCPRWGQERYLLTGSEDSWRCRSAREPRNGTCSGETVEAVETVEDKRYVRQMPLIHLCEDRSWCVTGYELCDGKLDCPDGSDEKHCDCKGMWNCTICRFREKDQPFQCRNGCGCVEKEEVCDGKEQCEDGSDEFCSTQNCSKVFCEKFGTYQCDSIPCQADSADSCARGWRFCDGFCIRTNQFCNGVCADDYYNCSGECISDYLHCNGVCRKYHFACGPACEITEQNYQFITCDGVEDCPDGNDEKGCDCPGMWNCTTCLQGHKFKCKDLSACVKEEQICDGVSQCSDGSDEFCSQQNCTGWISCWGSKEYQCSSIPCTQGGKLVCHGTTYNRADNAMYLCNGSCLDKSQPCNDQCLPGRILCADTGSCLASEIPCQGVCQSEDQFECGGMCEDKETHVYCGGKCWNTYLLKIKFTRWWEEEGVEEAEEYTRTCDGKCLTPDQPCQGSCPESRLECSGTCWDYHEYYFTESKVWGKEAHRLPCNDNCDLFGVRCNNQSVCITHKSVCDGKADCDDGSDEDEDFCSKCKEMKLFKDNQYIPSQSWTTHCITETIHDTCPHQAYPFKCGHHCLAEDKFCQELDSCLEDKEYIHSCGDGSCVKAENVCDVNKDCLDGSDEESCDECKHGMWKCGQEFQCFSKPCDLMLKGRAFFKTK